MMKQSTRLRDAPALGRDYITRPGHQSSPSRGRACLDREIVPSWIRDCTILDSRRICPNAVGQTVGPFVASLFGNGAYKATDPCSEEAAHQAAPATPSCMRHVREGAQRCRAFKRAQPLLPLPAISLTKTQSQGYSFRPVRKEPTCGPAHLDSPRQ